MCLRRRRVFVPSSLCDYWNSRVNSNTPCVVQYRTQATFGATRETIDSLLSTSNDYGSWIDDQINSVPGSSHREFLRSRTNPKYEVRRCSTRALLGRSLFTSRWHASLSRPPTPSRLFTVHFSHIFFFFFFFCVLGLVRLSLSTCARAQRRQFPYHVGAVGPRPCELHSRWRTYAITSRDMLSNRKTGWSKHLKIEAGPGGKYVWTVDGQLRTVTDTVPGGMSVGVRYKIPHRFNSWKVNCVGEFIQGHPP